MSKANLIKENISLELAYSFRGLVNYHHGQKQGSRQPDILIQRPHGRHWMCFTLALDWAFKTSKFHLQSDTLPLQGHTPYRITPLNSATPCEPSIQTHESMGAKLNQTTTHSHSCSIPSLPFFFPSSLCCFLPLRRKLRGTLNSSVHIRFCYLLSSVRRYHKSKCIQIAYLIWATN